MQIETVIIAPVVTEKASGFAQNNLYSFEVHMDASKTQIAEALQKLYKVKVSTVRVMTRKGKERRAGRKMQASRTPDRKIAYIKVSEGSIDLFPKT